MNRLIIIGALLLSLQSIFCQADSFGDWIMRIEMGIEEHDKRLGRYEVTILPFLNDQTNERWGTYHFGMNLQRRIINYGKLEVYGGTGIAYEKATFRRPFNHQLFTDEPVMLILLTQDQYRKIKTPLNFLLLIRLSENFYISSDIRLNWLVYRRIGPSKSNSSGFPYSHTTLELDDINLQMGILWRIKNLNFGVTSRIVNYQKIDKIIDMHYITDSSPDQKWEWYNPLRFDFTVGYSW
ncbi:MAG: hypothetical protein EA362_00695 [Saprospirales bacterium]|nr:MAG: hypothetical protein EA362_00695 [Saprospirales bacterium]